MMTVVRFYDCAKCAAIKQAWCEDKGIAFSSDECPVRVRDARIASLEAESERLRAAMLDALGEVGAADVQSLASDDQIIMGHVRDAASILHAALKGR